MTFEPAADFLTLKTVKIIKIYPKLLYDDSSWRLRAEGDNKPLLS